MLITVALTMDLMWPKLQILPRKDGLNMANGARHARVLIGAICVGIDMANFVCPFQPEMYEEWIQGNDKGIHPEDPRSKKLLIMPNLIDQDAPRVRKAGHHQCNKNLGEGNHLCGCETCQR